MPAASRPLATAKKNPSAQKATKLAGSRIAVVILFTRSSELEGDAWHPPVLSHRLDPSTATFRPTFPSGCTFRYWHSFPYEIRLVYGKIKASKLVYLGIFL